MILQVNRFNSLAWPEPKCEAIRKEWKKGSHLMMSPLTEKQEGGALYYHMPDTQTGRSTVMKTDE